MFYLALAEQLLNARANLLQVPANQQLSKMVQGELFVLYYLDAHTGVTHPKDLSEKMSVSTARIASLLNHMEGKGLVTRYTDSSDNRQVIVELTEEGKNAIAKVKAEVLSHLAAMLESLGPDDAQEYIRIQEKIWTNFHKQN